VVFWLEKKDGYTKIEGDQMGYLWRQGFFGGE